MRHPAGQGGSEARAQLRPDIEEGPPGRRKATSDHEKVRRERVHGNRERPHRLVRVQREESADLAALLGDRRDVDEVGAFLKRTCEIATSAVRSSIAPAILSSFAVRSSPPGEGTTTISAPNRVASVSETYRTEGNSPSTITIRLREPR